MTTINGSQITYDTYQDKVLGAWIGKSLGGIVGAPFEGHKILGDMKSDGIWPPKIFPNDDLDIQVVWLEMLEERGSWFTSRDLVEFWQDRCWYNFAEYGVFLNNVQRGINPPVSGRFNNTYFKESMGCPIRAEIWGLVAPGNPELAAQFAKMDGELDHIDNSVWAEQFWAAAVATAFCSDSLEDLLDAGRKVVPEDSDVYRISTLVPELFAQRKGNWARTWRDIVRLHGNRDGSKGQVNFAFTILALQAARTNPKEAITLAANLGWDTDCTAATAGALLGALLGASSMPADWMEKMGDKLTCDVNVRHKEATLKDFAADTCKVGLEMATTRNTSMLITDVPRDLAAEVKKRISARPAVPQCEIVATYPCEPVIWSDRTAQATLQVRYTGARPQAGTLTIKAPKGMIVAPATMSMELTPGMAHDVNVYTRRKTREKTLWDKNIFETSWTASQGDAAPVKCQFGFAGARQWRVYGPYWDIYDTTKHEKCPYRNDEINCNPCGTGNLYSGMHFHVRLDKPFLDEKRILREDIPEEDPVLVERGEDHIDSSHIGGFLGESVYYLVREISASEKMEANMICGSTAPFVLWLNGKEMCRNDRTVPWFNENHNFKAAFDTKPSRLVVKIANEQDSFRFSICGLKLNVVGDKTIGHSYIIDQFGDSVRYL